VAVLRRIDCNYKHRICCEDKYYLRSFHSFEAMSNETGDFVREFQAVCTYPFSTCRWKTYHFNLDRANTLLSLLLALFHVSLLLQSQIL
jgi:hypothetical protein